MYILGFTAVIAIIIITMLVAIDIRKTNNLNADSAGLAMASAQSNIKWTAWIDSNRPSTVGDYELISDIRKTHPEICANPIAIQCTTSDGAAYSSTKQNVTCDTNIGLVCKNSLNGKNSKKINCKDYKIRIGCPVIPQTCNDSDGGKNYYVKGTISGPDKYGNGNPKADYCGAGKNSKILMEGFCDNGYVNFISYTCPNGCVEGACITQTDSNVCCESFGYGANMIKTTSTYTMMPKSQCANCITNPTTGINQCITGGGRNIVNNSYCKTVCPLYLTPQPGWCTNGKIALGTINKNGCQGPPTCNLIPTTCITDLGFGCLGKPIIINNSITFSISNGIGYNIYLESNQVSLSNIACPGSSNMTICGSGDNMSNCSSNYYLESNNTSTLILRGCSLSNTNVNGTVSFNYTSNYGSIRTFNVHISGVATN